MPRLEANATAGPGPDRQTGTLTARFDTATEDWLVYGAAHTGPTNSIARYYIDTIDLANFRAVSYFGQLDDGDDSAGLLVPARRRLIVAWFDVTNGITNPQPLTSPTATGTVHIEYELAPI